MAERLLNVRKNIVGSLVVLPNPYTGDSNGFYLRDSTVKKGNYEIAVGSEGKERVLVPLSPAENIDGIQLDYGIVNDHAYLLSGICEWTFSAARIGGGPNHQEDARLFYHGKILASIRGDTVQAAVTFMDGYSNVGTTITVDCLAENGYLVIKIGNTSDTYSYRVITFRTNALLQKEAYNSSPY